MAAIIFEGVGKVYPGGTRAIISFDLEVADGELMVFVGPSGCGKTTALRMVAGLEEITDGTISIGGRVVNDVPAKDRDIAMVFQSYALYPHMSVFDNMAFGLKLRKLDGSEIRSRVERAADLLAIRELLDRKPAALSGGQRQRVAMGRAIVREPQAFLMDEPLSNLDAKLRVQMRAEVSALQGRLGTTTIYVTHDQVEAMTMGDRVAVIRKGELQQVGPPQELYDRPANVFVGGFIGSPAMNLLLAQVQISDGAARLRVGSVELPLDARATHGLVSYNGRDVVVGIRPEHLTPAAESPRLTGTVRLAETLGAEVLAHVEVEARPAVTDDVRELAADVGEEQTVARRAAEQTSTIVARLSPRRSAAPGERIELAVDTAKVHVFDPATGIAIRDNSEGGGP